RAGSSASGGAQADGCTRQRRSPQRRLACRPQPFV
ncbi:hypothetical protein XPN_1669, partial [Xanthomonas arboricola pv. pruni MAFF 301427]